MYLQHLLGFWPVNWGDHIQTSSHVFAKWIGLYLIIMGLYTLLRSKSTLDAIKNEVRRSPAIELLLASANVFFGSFFVAIHSVFVWGWPVIITLFGYLLLVKGILKLFFRKAFEEFHDRLGDTFCRAWSIVWLILGVILFWYGYFSRV